MIKLEVTNQDITILEVDAIVNAANPSLLAGGGVCGAIHQTAGPELEIECMYIGGCPVGSAVLTCGYSLPAKNVIHAVGPNYLEDPLTAAPLLAQCYNSILHLADFHHFKTIAIPCISTGIYGFPKGAASMIAVETVLSHKPISLEKVIFCCVDELNLHYYIEAIS